MKVFVTGGTGFIGSHVVVALRQAGHEVTILARNPRKVHAFTTMEGVSIIDGQIFDFDRIEKGMAGHDACIHVALGWGDSAMDMLMNETRPSVFICEAAAKAGVKHFVYCSSIEAVGPRDRKKDESMIPLPTHVYGATKAAAESYVLAIGSLYGMRVNIVRPGCTLGNPACDTAPVAGNRMAEDWVKRALNNETFSLDPDDGIQITDGSQVAQVFRAVVESEFDRRIYFGMASTKLYLKDLIGEAIAQTGSQSTIEFTRESTETTPDLFETDAIKRDFGLQFDAWEAMVAHIRYYVKLHG